MVHEIAVKAIMEGFMGMALLMVATTTISDIEQRRIEQQSVFEDRRSLSDKVVVWQTIF